MWRISKKGLLEKWIKIKVNFCFCHRNDFIKWYIRKVWSFTYLWNLVILKCIILISIFTVKIILVNWSYYTNKDLLYLCYVYEWRISDCSWGQKHGFTHCFTLIANRQKKVNIKDDPALQIFISAWGGRETRVRQIWEGFCWGNCRLFAPEMSP